MFADFFIKRPVFTSVCALIILLVGAISIPTLPVARLPEISPPQVVVTANYVGASAEIVEFTCRYFLKFICHTNSIYPDWRKPRKAATKTS